MTPFQMYLLILLSKLPGFGQVIMMVGMLVAIVSSMIYGMGKADGVLSDETAKTIVKILKSGIIVAVIGGLTSFFGVDLKQLAIIYGVPAVVNNEQAQQLPDNVLKVVNTWLEEQAEDEE